MADPENTGENTSGSGFLGRWSRRKLDQSAPVPAVAESAEDGVGTGEAGLLESGADQQSLATHDQAGLAEQDVSSEGARLLTDEDMPPLESLNADSDYSPFFSEGVSKQLRNLALKKLFFSGKFALRDGLDDYDDDFTKFEPLGNTVTSDMKFHERRKEKARLAKLEEERLEQERLEQERLEQEQQEIEQLAANERGAESEELHQELEEQESEDSVGDPTDVSPETRSVGVDLQDVTPTLASIPGNASQDTSVPYVAASESDKSARIEDQTEEQPKAPDPKTPGMPDRTKNEKRKLT